MEGILLRSKRIDEIENYIYKHKSVTLNQLCDVFGVSKNTIRRDVDEIVSKGHIKKIYGGVSVKNQKELVSFDERNIKNLVEKKQIAEKAAELVADGDIIFVDSGTTTSHLINYIKDRQDVTVLTNNLDFIIRSMPYENINIISLSGTLNRKVYSFTGQSAVNVLKDYNLNKAFMAAAGVSIENGVTNSSISEFEIKQMAVQRSRQVFLLINGEKIGETSLVTYCGLEQIDTLITEKKPPKEYYDYMAQFNHSILLSD